MVCDVTLVCAQVRIVILIKELARGAVKISSLGFRAPNLRFFWVGLGLGYVMGCDVTVVCVQVRSVILIKELA